MTPPLHRTLGLTDDEAGDIARILGREPNPLELAMYGVMWSEHCSYKSSRIHLRRLPSEGEGVLVGPGENAGVVDVGDGIAAAVPTVGGEVVCDATYAENPLVNVLCLGLLPVERLVLGRASGVGNVAVLLGSTTGRDGIGGVSVLASAGFGGGDQAEEAAKR